MEWFRMFKTQCFLSKGGKWVINLSLNFWAIGSMLQEHFVRKYHYVAKKFCTLVKGRRLSFSSNCIFDHTAFINFQILFKWPNFTVLQEKKSLKAFKKHPNGEFVPNLVTLQWSIAASSICFWPQWLKKIPANLFHVKNTLDDTWLLPHISFSFENYFSS